MAEGAELLEDPAVERHESPEAIDGLHRGLVRSRWGEEPSYIAGALVGGLAITAAAEAVSLAATDMNLAMDIAGQNAAIGAHVALRLARDAKLPYDIRVTSLLTALPALRSRGLKAEQRSKIKFEMVRVDPYPRKSDLHETLDHTPAQMLEKLRTSCARGDEGLAAAFAAVYFREGNDSAPLLEVLLKAALYWQSPSAVVQTTEYVLGMYEEYRLCRSEERWKHMAAAARVAAWGSQPDGPGASAVARFLDLVNS